MTYQNLTIPFMGTFLILLGYKLDGSGLTWVAVLSPLWGYCLICVLFFVMEKILYITEPFYNKEKYRYLYKDKAKVS